MRRGDGSGGGGGGLVKGRNEPTSTSDAVVDGFKLRSHGQ